MGKVEHEFRDGLVKAVVWQNVSKQGEVFRSVSLSKAYRKDGEWKNTSSLNDQDVLRAIEVLRQASQYLESTPIGEDADGTEKAADEAA